VFGAIFGERKLMKSNALLRDGKKLPIPDFANNYVKQTMIGQMPEEYWVI
jgi:oleate hydratase